MTTNAQLGRDAERTVTQVKRNGSYGCNHYVNKTPKYISIKLETDHLTDKQLDEVGKILHALHPDRFLAVYNNTATPSSRGMTWKAEKVNVRFTQS